MAEALLVVYQQPQETPEIRQVIQELKVSFGIDPFTSRQHLVGIGPALLASGEYEDMRRILQVLKDKGIRAWVAPMVDKYKRCAVAKGAVTDRDGLTFQTGSGENIAVRKGARVFCVITDRENKIAGDSVYRWAMMSNKPSDADIQKEIVQSMLKRSPVVVFFIKNPGESGWQCVAVWHTMYRAKHNDVSLNINGILSALRGLAVDMVIDPYFGINRFPNCAPNKSGKRNFARHSYLMDNGRSSYSLNRNHKQDVLPAMARIERYGIYMLAGFDELLKIDQYGEGSGFQATQDVKDEGMEPSVSRLSQPLPPIPVRRSTVGFGREWVGFFILLVAAYVGWGNVAHSVHQYVYVSHRLSWMAMLSVITLLAVGLWMMWRSLYYFKLYQYVMNTPTSKIRSATEGLVEVVGKAIRRSDLITPMTNRPCVYYRVKRFRKRIGIRGQEQWVKVSDDHSVNSPFWVDDGTGVLMVAPDGANIYCKEKVTVNSGLSGHEKVVEEFIPEFSEVYCMGFLRTLRGDKSRKSLKDRVIERLRRLKSNKRELMKYDLDHNGRIDQDEWDLAVRQIRQQEAKNLLLDKNKGEQISVIGKPGIKGMPFIVSHGRPEQVSRRFVIASILLLAIGILGVINGLIMVFKVYS